MYVPRTAQAAGTASASAAPTPAQTPQRLEPTARWSDLKSDLPEMPIQSECQANLPALHHSKARAIREREVLVGIPLENAPSLLLSIGIDLDDLDPASADLPPEPDGRAVAERRSEQRVRLDKKTSAVAQQLAALSVPMREAIASRERSLSQVRREIKAKAVRRRVSLPDAKFRVLCANPPWSYNDKATFGGGAACSEGL